ncbi:integrase [Vibrio campbellii]|nr:integrase [Vibrio campbellii]
MYLLRLPNSVYYTRIATPHSLHSRGYPKEIRFSLFTKERRIACLRNVDQTKIILSLFEHANGFVA